ncbi:hypothetical protein CN193_08935 [Sinorhizobium meliloti]|nr:hypothetical protein CN193_08935 [Sinorhizobium meliloti]
MSESTAISRDLHHSLGHDPVCLLSAPEKCREERLELEIQDSLTQCMFRSVMYVSNWSGQHPGLSVRKWRCEVPVASRDA